MTKIKADDPEFMEHITDLHDEIGGDALLDEPVSEETVFAAQAAREDAENAAWLKGVMSNPGNSWFFNRFATDGSPINYEDPQGEEEMQP
jgi:hypothetical protein